MEIIRRFVVGGTMRVLAIGEPGAGNAHHEYRVVFTFGDPEMTGSMAKKTNFASISFQNGPIKEAGVNGIHNEDLLYIVADRLAAFQSSQFACKENSEAHWHVRCAIDALERRTARREAAGIEGTHTPDAPVSAKPARHPAVSAILQFFAYAHLPSHLQIVSKRFADLAEAIADGPNNAEATVALRKLLEAKDAAVRAAIFKP